jgi:hypothetical protein
VYALEVLDRYKGSWSRTASLLRDTQPVTYWHVRQTHFQYWSKQRSEGTLVGGKKKGGDKNSLVGRHCLGKIEGTARTAIASGAAFGSRILLQVFLVVLERCGPGSHTVGDASQRTKAAHSRGPVGGRGHGRPQA